MIKRCTCQHEYQDSKYGRGMRVHTVSKKGEPRCTVCNIGQIFRKMRAIAMNWKPVHG